MKYFLLVFTTIMSAQTIITKEYNKRNTYNTPLTYSAGCSLVAMLFFLVNARFRLEFDPEILPYSVAFAVSFFSSVAGNVIAVGCGSMSITSLFLSYSMIIPAFYGILFLNERFSWSICIGLILFILSLILINNTKRGGTRSKVNPKWILFLVIMFVGNGMCGAIQRTQQIAFRGACKNEFMIFSLLIVVLLNLSAALICERRKMLPSLKRGWGFMALHGLSSGIVNLMAMILGALFPVSVMFPVISAGSTVFAALASVFLYHERLSKPQITGIAIGIVAIVFLNL